MLGVNPPPLPSAEALLAHAGALRALARQVVRGAASADDAVQETWLRALEHRPKALQNPFGWLAQVLRNEARLARRRQLRSARRERTRARPEASPSASDAAEGLALRRQLLDAVTGLDPIYRDVVYLRFFEDLPRRAIAARLGVPRRTVDTRLARGLAQLRDRLDRAHDGSRRAWLAGMVALARRRPPVFTLTLATLMQTKLALVGSAALAVASIYLLLAADHGGADAPAPARAEGSGPTLSVSAGTAAEARGAGDAERRTELAAPGGATPAAATSRAVRGIVLDTQAQPVAGSAVRYVAFHYQPDRKEADEAATLTATTGEDGRFVFPTSARNTGEIRSADPRFTTVLAGVQGLDEEISVVVAPATRFAGEVTHPDGTPVAAADVTVELPAGFRTRLARPLGGSRDERWRTTTDVAGRFALEAAPLLEACRLGASAAEHETAAVTVSLAERDRLRIVLPRLAPPAAELLGVVLDAEGKAVRRALVALDGETQRTGDDGGFRFRLPPEGADHLTAVVQDRLPVVVHRRDQPGGRWPPRVEVRLTQPPLVLAGRVLAADGHPCGHAHVWVHDVSYFGRQDGMPVTLEHTMAKGELLWRAVTSDAEGRFLIPGLADRAYEVRAVDDRTLQQVAVADVRAGNEDVVVRFPAHGLVAKLVGRVVDRDGHGIGGVGLHVERDAFVYGDGKPGGDQWLCQARGPATMTDDLGAFVLENVAAEGVYLRLHAQERLITDTFHFADERVTTPVGVRVQLRCQIRIDLAGSAFERADGAEVLDAAGKRLRIERDSANEVFVEQRTRLTAGRSEVLAVPDAAVEVVLREGDEIVGRLPVRPQRDGVAVVKP